jgi:hypothetical protein
MKCTKGLIQILRGTPQITQNKTVQDRFGSQHGTSVVSIQNEPITHIAFAVTAKQTPFLSP